MTVTDTLQTLLKLTGGPQYKAGLDTAAKGLDNVAKAEAKQQATSRQLRTAFTALGGSYLFTAGAIGAFSAVIGDSIKTFADDEQQIFRTTVVLRNLGNTLPIERVQAFASQIQKTAAIDDEAVVALVGLEKRFGIADSQIEQTTKTILDFSKATGIDLQEAGELVGRAMLGQSRGLKRLGIDMQDTGDKAKNLALIQQKLNALFGGAAEAQRNTLAGTFTALSESLKNLLSAVGDKLSTVIVPVLNQVVKVIDYLTSHVYIFSAAIGAAIGATFGGPLGALIGGIAGLGVGLLPSRGNAAEKIGTGKERLATEGTLSEIAKNTKTTADAFVKAVLGGPGTVARGAFTARDARIAFGI